jgi:hypothetical protein
MLRITEDLENPQTVRLKLDGILSAETYEDFEQVFAAIRRSRLLPISPSPPLRRGGTGRGYFCVASWQ